MSDVAATSVAMQQAMTQHSAQLLMVKQNHDMEQNIIDMLSQAVESSKPPAPAGMGKMIDKSA
ncbi:putative motility protein [Pelagibacterium lentulum]|uniref:Motility protein n=1 Tax=Pelagibacterium lentulum TaxID=2029865 RepID=A0A916R4S0_9HYPH|nr:putative motility protein [Pelagibacterium lentulum]GGA35340.1 hypothetical protein GCM10011499_00800 [Pelagibacterium lentulum]